MLACFFPSQQQQTVWIIAHIVQSDLLGGCWIKKCTSHETLSSLMTMCCLKERKKNRTQQCRILRTEMCLRDLWWIETAAPHIFIRCHPSLSPLINSPPRLPLYKTSYSAFLLVHDDQIFVLTWQIQSCLIYGCGKNVFKAFTKMLEGARRGRVLLV